MTEDENEQNAMKCFDELRDSHVPRQELMESRTGGASLAAKIRGWQQTLEALERGELSNSEVELILRHELPRALEEGTTGPLQCVGDADATREWAQLARVLGKVVKALECRLKALRLRVRTPRWPSRRRSQ